MEKSSYIIYFSDEEQENYNAEEREANYLAQFFSGKENNKQEKIRIKTIFRIEDNVVQIVTYY